MNNYKYYKYISADIESLINLIYWYAQEYHFTDFGHAGYIARLTEFSAQLDLNQELTQEEQNEITNIDQIVDDWFDY